MHLDLPGCSVMLLYLHQIFMRFKSFCNLSYLHQIFMRFKSCCNLFCISFIFVQLLYNVESSAYRSTALSGHEYTISLIYIINNSTLPLFFSSTQTEGWDPQPTRHLSDMPRPMLLLASLSSSHSPCYAWLLLK